VKRSANSSAASSASISLVQPKKWTGSILVKQVVEHQRYHQQAEENCHPAHHTQV
jgi:hypothetical protein